MEKQLSLKIIDDAPDRKTCRRFSKHSVFQVYEIEPLKCPKCGARMKIIAFIQEREEIIRILIHLAMWPIEFPRPAAINAEASPLDFKLMRKSSVLK